MNVADGFREACANCDLTLSETQLSRALLYFELLRKWNRRISLTSVENDRELIRLHFVEAFWAASHFLEDGLLADIGAGAGFPGLAAKLYRPELQITLIERSFKKCIFLETVARELDLSVTVVRGSAEHWTQWSDVRMAAMRALQPEAALLAPLEAHSVPLLYFRGPRSTAPAGWHLIREGRFPLSERRMISLYRFT